MRSRASGGTCGDSIAAASAATMSSLRRRAIWVQRAMSTERSSIGGRASARTTAPASVGSASSRSHASTSRISARWKNAASPTRRCGIARSSSATLTAWPSWVISGTSTAIRPGGDRVARQQALDVDRHRLGLGALVGAAPQLALAAGGRGAGDRRGGSRPSASTARGAARSARGSAGRARARPRARPAPSEAAHPRRAGPAVAPQARVGIAGDRSPPGAPRPPGPASPAPGRAPGRRRAADSRSAGRGWAARGPGPARRRSGRRRRARPASASIRSWVQ